MIVADLIKLLQDCHPRAVVLIPADPSMGQACEPVSDVAALASKGFAGRSNEAGVVRLSGFPISLLVGGLDVAQELVVEPKP